MVATKAMGLSITLDFGRRAIKEVPHWLGIMACPSIVLKSSLRPVIAAKGSPEKIETNSIQARRLDGQLFDGVPNLPFGEGWEPFGLILALCDELLHARDQNGPVLHLPDLRPLRDSAWHALLSR